ncbi:efflux RND transporter periplasmic adaptor subunit [Candidatus Falkowbacteria bacterium]|nr:efflux RND transporter periplasmic adaptor subunit [Candidatus Falkowbacteria bacterium]
MNKIKITKKIILAGIAIILTAGISALLWLFPVMEVEEYTTAAVQKRDLIQTVSEVGSIKASTETDLSFGQSGELRRLFVRIGDKVEEGQVLAELDYQTFLIQKEEAESNLAAAQANLNKVLYGATREEIAVAQAQADQAEQSYYSALDNLEKTESKVSDAIAQAEKSLNDLESDDPSNITATEQAVSSAEKDLVNTKNTYQNSIDNYEQTLLTTIASKLDVADNALDEIKVLIDDDDIDADLSSKNKTYLNNTISDHSSAEILLAEAEESLATAQANPLKLYVNDASDKALDALDKTADALDNCFKALEASTISQSALNTYKSNINTEISAVNTAISSVETAVQNLADARLAYNTNVSSAEETLKKAQAALSDAIVAARNSLSTAKLSGDKELASARASVSSSKKAWDVAESQLAQLKAPARREDIDLYRSKVRQAKASLDLIGKQIEDSVIRSPIDGRVVKSEFELGEQVGRSVTAISVLKENEFEIEIDISESDIAKVEVDDMAEITLDAFGDDVVFKGKVGFIEPAETVIQDVIYYKVRVDLDDELDNMENIKSGMTANVTITTGGKNDVLVVPMRAVLESGDKKYIRVWKDGRVEEHEVDTGLRGDGGYIEIFDHVKKGDEVITYTKEVEKRTFRFGRN